LEELQSAGNLQVPLVTETIIEYPGADDERITKLTGLTDNEQ